MMENRTMAIAETTIRFFSYFTILTNILVAVYLSSMALYKNNDSLFHKPGTLTAVTTYITIVGLVYQFILRSTWNPTGMQKVVDELLHSVMPVLTIIYWYLYEQKRTVFFKQIPAWLIYPLAYLVFILLRGQFSGFYPYPFVDVGNIGLSKALINSGILVAIFYAVCAAFITIGKIITPRNPSQ